MSNRIEQYDLISKEAVEVVKETTNALIKTLDSMKDLVASGVDLNKAFSGGAKGLGDTVKATKQVTDNTNLFVQTAKELEAQQAKLVAAQARQIAAQSEAAKETRKANALTSEQIKIAKLQAIVNDENAGKLEKLRAANGLLRIQKEKLKETDADYVKTMADLNAQMDANQEAINETNNSEQKRIKGIGEYKNAFGGVIQQFMQGEIGLKEMTKGVAKLGVQMIKSIVMNPVLLAFGAIVGAVMALYKAFSMTDSGGTALAAKFEQLKAIIDVVRSAVGGLAKGIVALFSGDSQTAAEEFGNAQKLNAERMREAAKAAKEYTYALDSIEDSENNYISRSAEMRNQIAKLEYSAADRTLSTEERKKALEEALKLGAEEVAQKKKFAEDRLNAEVDYLAKKNGLTRQEVLAFIKMTDEEQANASKSMKAARDNNEEKFAEIEELYAKAIDADTSYFEENKRNASKLSSFEKEIADDKAKKAADAAAKRKEREEKAAEELKKIEEARAAADLNAATRIFESRKMLAEQYVFNEAEKARQINAIEQEQINYSLSLLEQKLAKEKAGSAEAIKLADEIAAKKFDLEKKAMDAAKITADENKKLFEEADAMVLEQAKFEEEQVDKKMKNLEDYYAEQAYLARENIGLFSTNAKEREKQEQELAVKLLELQRAQLSEQLRLGDLTVEAERNAKQQLLDIDQQLADQKMANLEKEAEKRKEVTQMSLDLVSQGFDTISGIYDMQNARLDAQHEIDLARTEEGSEERILAEAKYDKEKRKLARKQAVLDRAQGLFNIGISTATAIMNALAQFGPIAGAIFAGIIGAMGAAQIATVLATPLPAYKDGGVVPFDQIARVSEEGQELMISPSGNVGLTPINESIMSLEKGTRIVPHNDTMKLLASQAYASIAIESNRSNKILEQIRDKSPDFVSDGYKYVNKKGLKGRYRL